MKKYLGITLILLSGCAFLKETVHQENGFIFPNSAFESDEFTTWWRHVPLDFKQPTNYTEEVQRALDFYVPRIIPTTNEYLTMMNDPFLNVENVRTVTFFSSSCAREIANYYTKAFANNGWNMVRDIYVVEQCLGGGDWIHIYKKKNKLTRIHVMGRWENENDETEMHTKGVSIRMIQIQFLGMEPFELLGNSYTNYNKIDLTNF